MGPEDLRTALAFLPPLDDPRVLVASEGFADAGVVRVRPDLALVQSVDFFTPIVDDPLEFGRIAAANALSDLYAMGAEPLCALNVVAFPETGVPFDVLGRILQGGAEKAAEAGAALLGGHSVRDEEIKYGLAVTGTIHPAEVRSNSGALPGDALFLTKPLGTGIVTTALKRDLASRHAVAAVVEGMQRLNRAAAAAARAAGAHAATDVTGFGFAGHAWQMAEASGVAFEIDLRNLPLYPDALALATAGVDTGGGRANVAFYGAHVRIDPDLHAAARAMLFDPQTSGGLLVAVPPSGRTTFIDELRAAGEESWEVGVVLRGGEPRLRVESGS